ncbi:unnamed protein product [Moneuplotes crassus]|uniref:PB1 domain-containing protein n=1 Tax=Euplotes crassus TaxID=5936 RepID=A0AAD1U6U7_EUPCR|nr:unnamed protein product [Moneuplotes crassus]
MYFDNFNRTFKSELFDKNPNAAKKNPFASAAISNGSSLFQAVPAQDFTNVFAEKHQKPCLKLKYNNRVKKIATIPRSFQKFSSIIQNKYEDFSYGKDSYKACYLDNEDDQVDISDDEDYEVFLQYLETVNQPSVKVFLNNNSEDRRFSKTIDDEATIHESILGDTMICSTLDRPNLAPQSNPRFPRLDELQKENEYLKSLLLQNETEKKSLEEGKSRIEPDTMKFCKNHNFKVAKLIQEEAQNAYQKYLLDQTETAQGVHKRNTVFVKNKGLIDKKVSVPQEIPEKGLKYLHSYSSEDEPLQKTLSDFDLDADLDLEFDDDNSTIQFVNKKTIDLDDEEVPLKSYPVKGSYDPLKNPFLAKNYTKQDEAPKITRNPFITKKEKVESGSNRKVQKKIPIEQIICSECSRDLKSETRFVCSIRNGYTLCERCELKRKDGYVFLKIPKGVKLDQAEYDKFCQKMLGIYIPPVPKKEYPRAILNRNKSKGNVRLDPVLRNMALIMNKQDYEKGVWCEKGDLVTLNFEIKNMSHLSWSNNIVLDCENDSDLLLERQKVNTQLRRGEEGNIEIKFLMLKNAGKRGVLKLKMYLGDMTARKVFGEPIIVKLLQFE